MSDKLEIKVKEWLLNDNNLIKQMTKIVCRMRKQHYSDYC